MSNPPVAPVQSEKGGDESNASPKPNGSSTIANGNATNGHGTLNGSSSAHVTQTTFVKEEVKVSDTLKTSAMETVASTCGKVQPVEEEEDEAPDVQEEGADEEEALFTSLEKQQEEEEREALAKEAQPKDVQAAPKLLQAALAQGQVKADESEEESDIEKKSPVKKPTEAAAETADGKSPEAVGSDHHVHHRVRSNQSVQWRISCSPTKCPSSVGSRCGIHPTTRAISRLRTDDRDDRNVQKQSRTCTTLHLSYQRLALLFIMELTLCRLSCSLPPNRSISWTFFSQRLRSTPTSSLATWTNCKPT